MYTKQAMDTLRNRIIKNHSTREIAKSGDLSKILADKSETLVLPLQTDQEDIAANAYHAVKNNAPVQEIMELIIKGLSLTHNTIQDYPSKPLVFYEPDLLHALAQLYWREKDNPKATQILETVIDLVEKYPPDNRTLDLQILPIMLTLADIKTETKDFNYALNLCNKGFDLAARRGQGRFCPAFLKVKANVLIAKGDTKPCHMLLTKAYAGYVAMGNGKAAHNILNIYQNTFNQPMDTYGMEQLLHDYDYTPPKIKRYQNFADALNHTLDTSKLSPQEVFTGICLDGTFSKLRYGTIKKPTISTALALMERLGYDARLCCELNPSPKELVLFNLQDEIKINLRQQNYKRTAEVLAHFKNMQATMRNTNNVTKQFIKRAEDRLYNVANGSQDAIYLNMLQETLKITIPHFNEADVATYALTTAEALLINNIAIYYEETMEIRKALRLYEGLHKAMKNHWVHDALISTMHDIVYCNFANLLDNIGEHKNALSIVNDAIAYSAPRENLTGLPGLYVTKADILTALGKKNNTPDLEKETLPLYMLAYYSELIFEDHGRGIFINHTKAQIKKLFDMDL